MNIVISTKSYYPLLGGSIVYGKMLAEAFSRANHKVTVITRTSGEDIPFRNYNLVRQPTAVARIQLAKDTDILMQVDASWIDAWPFILHKVPWFPTVHRGNIALCKLAPSGKARLLLERLGYRLGHAIGVSQYVVDSWNLRENAIPNPYDSEIFYEPSRCHKRDIDVLFVGRLTRDKGVFLLVEALKNLAENHDYHLRRVAFVGAGPVAIELQEIATHSLPHLDLLFPGLCDPKQVADFMRRSKVLAFPTTPDWLEASPLTPLEATACGCKVVAADIGGTRDNVSPSHWIVRSGCSKSLSHGLAAAMEAPTGIIDNVTRNFLALRTLDTVADLYLARFQSVLAANTH